MPIVIRPSIRATERRERNIKSAEERKFYSSGAWRRASLEHRRIEPLCRECARLGIVRAGEMVDHIKSLRKGGSALDPTNLQTLCNQHHHDKTQRDRGGRVEKWR